MNKAERRRIDDQWTNWHRTIGPLPIKWVDVITPPNNSLGYSANDIKTYTEQIQNSIRDALDADIECRAVGRTWSLSNAPYTSGAMIDLFRLNAIKRINRRQIDPAYPGVQGNDHVLCMAQGGARISDLNQWMESDARRLSARTTGAANGQTIAGATSTGTHGSVLGVGAMHDQIVSIHLVTGPNPGDQVWLERASYPVLLPATVAAYGAPLIRDDSLFNAAVVGLGAFGVIANVVFEARTRFMLEAFNFKDDSALQTLVYDADMRKRVTSLDFTSAPRLDPPGKSGTPYFFQAIIDPNTPAPHEVLITQMHERSWDPAARDLLDPTDPKGGPGYDVISVVGRFLNVFGFLVPLVSKLVANDFFKVGLQVASWGELFSFKSVQTKVASGTVAVDLSDAAAAIDALLELSGEVRDVPVVFGCRYVAKTKALIGFNKWDTTFVVSVDGIDNAKTRAFFDAIPAKMAQKGLAFTQHWGKTNGYNAASVRAAYGNANVDAWKAARAQIIPDPDVRAMFENDLIRHCGLDG